MALTDEKRAEIFYKIVGDPDDGPAQSHMWMMYMENIHSDSTVKEATEWCKLMVENEDEDNPGWRDEDE